MSDDIRAMTSEMARDPASLVFIRLGEALRARGQPDAALKVVRHGLERHPDSIEAHDLHARLLVEAEDLDGAEREWRLVIAGDERHISARKGLGFLCYRRGDVDSALDHLEFALSADPSDASVVQALRTVRAAAGEAPPPPAPAPAPGEPVPVPVEGHEILPAAESPERGMLLVDPRGRVLSGGITNPAGVDAAEAVAAHLAGASQEAERTTRMLELGEWTWIAAEATDGSMHVTQPEKDVVLLLVRDRSVPPGLLAVMAERASKRASGWLKGQGQ